MSSAPLIPAVLTRLGYAVFEDAGAGALSPVGELPHWFARAFGPDAVTGGRFVPGDTSPFLENFLPQAEAVWSSGEPLPRGESGGWIERGPGGEELALEAEALLLEGRRILLILNPQERFEETRRVLQLARNDKLSHERLLREIQTKEVLLHCIVHDLSQPLTALRGCLSLLGMGLPAEKLREVVEIADRQTRRQETMIRDVLNVFASEMAALQGGGAAAGVDVAQSAREVVQEYSAAFVSQGAALAADPRLAKGCGWRATGEPERLRRLFANFLENALRYSPAGTTVTVGVEEDGDFLRAYVDDQGPGLPEGVTAANLFRLFGKGKESTGKAGLGLYFCKITAERWGGSVGCENRAGGGTRFWFRLPRLPAAREPASPGTAPAPAPFSQTRIEPVAAAAAGGATVRDARSLRILLADDVEINRQIAEELLARAGHRVTSVEDGRAAVAAVQREPFDLVLMDVEMPVMNGLEAAQAIRAWEGASAGRLPILAVTGHDTPADRERIRSAGMDGQLVKPFDSEALYREIAAVCATAPPRPAEQEVSTTSGTGPARCGASMREQLLARFGGDARLAASLARLFLKDAPRLQADVRGAVDRRDSEGLARAAHALKGAVGHFGAEAAREAAARLERIGREGDVHHAGEAFEQLSARLSTLCEELSAFANESSGRSGRVATAGQPSKRSRGGSWGIG